jgi:hypothetical protein
MEYNILPLIKCWCVGVYNIGAYVGEVEWKAEVMWTR